MELYLDDAYTKINDLLLSKTIVSHIITDPPYNISKENNFSTMNSVRTGIDFGEWDKNFDLFSWIPLYTKLLDKNGSMIIFCSYLYISDIIKVCEQSDLVMKDVLVWQKTNPMPRNVNRRYVQDMEFAIWAVKRGAKWVFNKPEDKSYLSGFWTNDQA